ncbi:unnamed protein product [Acanthoscelides obtectus]|uniref:Uncharacterized protein n=1 Tax=Acanthoscelides obtectus TaxID=200917 RepID=A0A9P0KVD5_ACAOB|nr:unnamed protein product [Acanthoscelides obtectus]CAK1676153.1 hypothetical protein AOBTE_LOCUS30620 [Acanthoscelides obtectus]
MRHKPKKRKPAMKFRDVATQTELFNILDPRVVLNRLHPQEMDQIETKAAGKPTESLVTVLDKPARLSRLPQSYRLFAKPITNNENANSTLLFDDEDDLTIHNVAFAKPGPLCYKKGISKKMSRSLAAPQVRHEPEEREERNRLEPVIESFSESSQETISTPDILELNLNVSSIESMIEQGTQTLGSSQEDHPVEGNAQEKLPEPITEPQNNEEPSIPRINEEPAAHNCSNGEPIREEPRGANTSYRMKINGVATTITAGAGASTEDSTSDDSDNDDRNRGRRTKFVKIKAHTVHIHNHFYQK